jgi:uncharacterized protein (UPF0335 family)
MDGTNMPRDVISEQTGAELRAFIERIEQLEAEKRDIGDQIKEVYSEAKGRGYLTMPMRSVIKERRMNPDDRAEAIAILDAYRAAVGLR